MKCIRCGNVEANCPHTISGHCDWLTWSDAIIEECARVADSFEEAEFGYNPTAVKIAAAIRGRKDKP